MARRTPVVRPLPEDPSTTTETPWGRDFARFPGLHARGLIRGSAAVSLREPEGAGRCAA